MSVTAADPHLVRAAQLEAARDQMLKAWNAMERVEEHLAGGAPVKIATWGVRTTFRALMVSLTAINRVQTEHLDRAAGLEEGESGRKGGLAGDLLLLRHMDDQARAEAQRVRVVTTGLTLPEGLATALTERAGRDGTSVRAVIEAALAAYLAESEGWKAEDL